jgi:phage tail sheath gpL-like
MPVDSTARARVTGITTEYQDLRTDQIRFLPQRLLVVAQGATASTIDQTKFTPTSSAEVAAAAGFGSPAHQIALQLWPADGDGISTVPADFILMDDAATSTASTGDITPSGTTTQASTYYTRIGGVRSLPFSIPVGAIDVSDVLRDQGDAINAVLSMPMLATYTYSTVTDTPGASNVGDGTLSSLAVTTGRPGTWSLVCTAAGVGAGTFTLTDPNGTVISTALVASTTPGTAVDQAGLQFNLIAGATDYDVGDSFAIEVPATDMQLTSKWKGVSANDIVIEVIDELAELTFAITQPTGGTVNPTVDAAITQIGDVWNTMVINSLNIEDTTALAAYNTEGERRWGPLVHLPFIVFTGVSDATVANATAISSTRTTDRINSQLVAPGSPDLPCVICAAQVAKIIRQANNAPATDYALQRTKLIKGLDSQQWDYTERDTAVKAGSSTIEVKDSQVAISDVVTMYAPAGDDLPAYRWAVDIVKLQNVIYNINAIFESTNWAGKPLIAESQPTVDPDARKPSAAIAAIAQVADGLGLNSIIGDADAVKQSLTAVINSQNNRRLDTSITVPLSGNVGITDNTLKFGFLFA